MLVVTGPTGPVSFSVSVEACGGRTLLNGRDGDRGPVHM